MNALDLLGPAYRAEIEQLIDERVNARLAEADTRGTEAWPEWMSVETAARYLDLTEHALRKLKDRRAVPYYQQGPGCRVFFRRSELDASLVQHREGRARERTGSLDGGASCT